MKKARVLILVCIIFFSFSLNGFANAEQITESESSTSSVQLTAKVKDYEIKYYRSDGRGGYIPGPIQVYYKTITYENGYEIAYVQKDTIGSRDGSGYFIRYTYNYKTY